MPSSAGLEVHRRAELRYRAKRIVMEEARRRGLRPQILCHDTGSVWTPRQPPADTISRHDGGRIVSEQGDVFYGLACPWNRVVQVRDGVPLVDETFLPGAFTDSLRARPNVPILVAHDRGAVIGQTVDLHEAEDGLRAAFKVDDPSIAARLAGIRDQWRIGLSIGFRPKRDRRTPGSKRSFGRDLLERLAVDLFEISVVRTPAYSTAGVRSVA